LGETLAGQGFGSPIPVFLYVVFTALWAVAFVFVA